MTNPATSSRTPHGRVLAGEEIAALLAACAGPASRTSGMRPFRLSLAWAAPSWLRCSSTTTSSTSTWSMSPDAGRPPRAVPFDRPTARALEPYLAARALHPWAHLSHFWLGRRRSLTDRGVDQAIRHRGELAGVPNLHAHQFRHTLVEQYLADGGDSRDLMRLVGWRGASS